MHDAGRRRQQARLIEIRGPGEQEEDGRAEQQQVPAGLLADPNAVRLERDLARDHVGGGRAHERQRDDREEPETDEIEKRQREDVERGVVSDQRIGVAERRRLQILQDQQPLARGHPGDEERGQARGGHGQPGEMPPFEHDRLQVPAAGEQDVGALYALDGPAQVAEQPEESDGERGGPEQPPRRQALEEDALVVHLAEPEPFGVEIGQRRQRDEQDQRRECDCESRRH